MFVCAFVCLCVCGRGQQIAEGNNSWQSCLGGTDPVVDRETLFQSYRNNTVFT